jgi:hypothetical protein
LLAAAAPAEEPDLSWVDSDRLESGEILLKVDDDGRFRGHIEAAVSIAAGVEPIWAVLTDCPRAPEYVPNVLRCELLGTVDDGRAQLFRQEVRFAWFLPRFEHVFRLDFHPHTRIDVRKVSGPLERMEGKWWLLSRPEQRTLLLYSLDLDPGVPVPRFVVGSTLRRDLPRILSAVRTRAEALQ